MTEEFDPVAALAALNRSGVEYVVIGGFGAVLLGSSQVTTDLDLCYRRSTDNYRRLVDALAPLHARLRVPKVQEDLPFQLQPETIAAGGSFTFVTDLGDLDVLAFPSGTKGYDDLVTRAVEVELDDGERVAVASLDDLIAMKVASGRVKDRDHVLILRALQEVLAEQPE